MKAAGIITGIADEMRDFWMYDQETRRNSIDEDYKRHFSEFYTMNALSVKGQYDDEYAETDSNTYEKEFNECRKIGHQLVYNGGKVLQQAVAELSQFFSSAMYQTEYEPYMYKMQMYLDRLTIQLYEKAYHHEAESWGELKIEMPGTQYEVLF